MGGRRSPIEERDRCGVDPAVYAEFTRGLVARHCRTGHSVILALSESLVATAVALARRAGVEVEMPDSGPGAVCGGVQRDVRVPGSPRTPSAAVVTALDTRVREMDRWMAR
ncbi:DUF6086 family protein [Streptomyces sp. NPDC024017]|uniref:DUF6086 family protein n=1 Tax=Streptomyces sp. NPDC024017 TaxID=3154326 RepID=UPI0033E61959